MRFAPVLVVAVALPALALAGSTKPAVLEKLLAKHVTGLAKGEPDDKIGLAKDAIVIAPGDLELNADAGITTRSQAYMGAGAQEMKATYKLAKPTIAIDDATGLAYFQAPFNTHTVFFDVSGDMGDQTYKSVERVGGIAVLDGSTWKIAAAMWTRGLDSDAKLIKKEKEGAVPTMLPSGEPTITGDAKLGGIVRGWFKTGFAPAAAKTGKRIASGTGPKEFGVDAAALKMAKTWDKLGLVPSTIEVTQVAGGKAAFAKVQCIWKAQKGKTNIPMLLGIVLIPDGADWRWVSMQFSPD